MDPDGYPVRVAGMGVQAVPANGMVEIPGLSPGDRQVTLEDVWVYCGFPGTEAGTMSVMRTIEADATVDVVFTVACQPALRNRIVFSALRTAGRQIYAIRPDGTGNTQIGDLSPGSMGSFLTVSRDGTSLVYVTGGPEVTRLELMNSIGEIVGEIATAVSCPTTPGLSPDASRVAFTDCHSAALHVLDIDGTDEGRIGEESGYNATWTPGGDRIVYSRVGATAGTIAAIDRDGSDWQPITSQPDEQAFDPDVSPDGSRVVFVRARPTVPTTTSIHVINVDGPVSACCGKVMPTMPMRAGHRTAPGSSSTRTCRPGCTSSMPRVAHRSPWCTTRAASCGRPGRGSGLNSGVALPCALARLLRLFLPVARRCSRLQ